MTRMVKFIELLELKPVINRQAVIDEVIHIQLNNNNSSAEVKVEEGLINHVVILFRDGHHLVISDELQDRYLVYRNPFGIYIFSDKLKEFLIEQLSIKNDTLFIPKLI